MSQKTIHPTKHAIIRFQQRVLPHLPEESRRRFQKKRKILQRLYGLARRAEFAEEEHELLHVPAFFNVQGCLPVPLTLVIDPVNRTLCTLYISPGWQNVGSEEKPKWVWS